MLDANFRPTQADSGGGAAEAVGDGGPFGGVGGRFNDDQSGAGGIAAIELGVEGAGKGFGIVRDDIDGAEAASLGDGGVGDDKAAGQRDGIGGELGQ